MSGNGKRPDAAAEAEAEAEAEKDDSGKINGLQIAAATGAATTAAVVANALGIYGTVVGVAVFSVVSSVGSVVYLKSMRRTKNRIDRVRGRTSAGPAASRPADAEPARTGPVRGTATVVLPAVPATAAAKSHARPTGTAKVPAAAAAEPKPPESKPARAKRFLRRNWRAIAVSSVIVFGLSVGALTALALVSGQPATSYYGVDSPQSTTREPAPSEEREQSGPAGESESPDRPSGGSTPSEDEQRPSTSPTPSSEPESETDGGDGEGGDGDGDLKGTPSPQATDEPQR